MDTSLIQQSHLQALCQKIHGDIGVFQDECSKLFVSSPRLTASKADLLFDGMNNYCNCSFANVLKQLTSMEQRFNQKLNILRNDIFSGRHAETRPFELRSRGADSVYSCRAISFVENELHPKRQFRMMLSQRSTGSAGIRSGVAQRSASCPADTQPAHFRATMQVRSPRFL